MPVSKKLSKTAVKILRFFSEGPWRHLFTWTVVAVISPLAFGCGVGVLSMTPPEFIIAKVCFVFAAFLFLAKFSHWIVSQRTGRTHRMLITFIVFGIVGLGLVEAFTWIQNRQQLLAQTNDSIKKEEAPLSTPPQPVRAESDFVINRELIAVAPMSSKTEKLTAVTILLTIKNLGSSSAALNWLLAVKIPGREIPIGIEPWPFSGTLTLSVPGQPDTVLTQKDVLANKTLEPIPAEGIVRGYFHFRIRRPIEQINVSGTVLELWFKDIRDKEYKPVVYDSFPIQKSDFQVLPIPGVEIKKKPAKKAASKKQSISKKDNAEKSQYKIDRLKELIHESHESGADGYVKKIQYIHPDDTFSARTERFLEDYFDESHVERYRNKDKLALKEFLKELIS
jgi:hypothetical protein